MSRARMTMRAALERDASQRAFRSLDPNETEKV